jgi:alpha-galactosidase
MMILSDNYDRPEARERARDLANNEAVNALARIGRPFRPVELKSDTTPFYTLTHEGRHYAAVFNFSEEERTLSFRASRGGIPERGIAKNLWNGTETEYYGNLPTTLSGHDCAIFQIREECL